MADKAALEDSDEEGNLPHFDDETEASPAGLEDEAEEAGSDEEEEKDGNAGEDEEDQDGEVASLRLTDLDCRLILPVSFGDICFALATLYYIVYPRNMLSSSMHIIRMYVSM
jgi:hypothetical protein